MDPAVCPKAHKTDYSNVQRSVRHATLVGAEPQDDATLAQRTLGTVRYRAVLYFQQGSARRGTLYQDMVIWCSCCCSLVKCGSRPAGGIAAAIIAGPIGIGIGIGIGAAPQYNMLHTIVLTCWGSTRPACSYVSVAVL